MANVLAELLVKITTDMKEFTGGLKTADSGLSKLRGQIEQHRKAIGIAMLGMATAVIGGAIASIKAYIDMGDEVQKMALRTGLGAEALSELKYAAELSGTSLASFETATKKMSKSIIDANDGLTTYTRAFDRIGLSAKELMGLKPEEQFMKVAMAIASLDDVTIRTATAVDIFGRSGTDLLPLLAEGADGIAKLRQEAHDLGIVFDEESAVAATRLKDNFERLNKQITGLKFTVAKELMPSIEYLIPILSDWAKALGPIIENTLNWHNAYDKQIKQQDAWRDMMSERQKFLGGLNNQYIESIDYLESVLKSQGLLNEQAVETIKKLKEESSSRQELNTDIENTNELLKEQEEAYSSAFDKVTEAIQKMEYERSEAGRLRIGIDDIIAALSLMGKSNDEITKTLVSLGDEQNNVLKVLDAFGITALDVANKLGKVTSEIDKQKSAVKSLHDTIKSYGTESWRTQQEEMARAEAEGRPYYPARTYYQSGMYAEGGRFYSPTGADITAQIESSQAIYAGLPSFQHGGRILEDTLLMGMTSLRPYAMAHEGEVVTEARAQGITINFTQPVFFDREDTMNRFVEMIRRGIQRQDRLRFGGAWNGR